MPEDLHARLAALTAADIRALIGETVRVKLPSGLDVEGTLADVRSGPPGPLRETFSFFVLAPVDPSRPAVQGNLRIEHEKLPAIEVFAVPLGGDGDRIRWQVVFG